MCVRSTEEGCILLSQMSDLQKTVANIKGKQWVLIALVAGMFIVLSFGFFKLLDSQIYLLSGERGLKAISDEAQEDIQVFKSMNTFQQK